MSMKNEVVLVTGAARGIGRDIATTLAGMGAKIAVTDIDENVKSLHKLGFAIPMDVTDEDDVKEKYQNCTDALGEITLVINNAGILSVHDTIDLEVSEWRRVIEVNATGTFIVSKTAAKHMLLNKAPSSIINISSIGGKRGSAGVSHYCSSKFAVIGFTQALAIELGQHNINVNAICPGAVITDMFNKFVEGQRTKVSEWVAKQQVSRPQTGQEIAHAISFLHEARSITGQALNVDGGTVFN
jgi:meso-butanediol dehydrogenase/(S,S)-butanediol dehydrogenase/diacetyl reductase